MEEVEPNGDGRISPTNFGWWLSDEGNPNGVRRTTAAGFACHSSRVDSVGEGSTQPDEDVTQHDGNARAGFRGDQLEGQGHIVMRARKLLCLDCFSVNDLLEILAEVAIMVSLKGTALALHGRGRECPSVVPAAHRRNTHLV